MEDPLAVVLAFTAFGANLVGAIFLLLLNSGSRTIRWYVLFLMSVNFWLLSQGMVHIDAQPFWTVCLAYAVCILPMTFFVFAVSESNRPWWHGVLLLAVLSAFLPWAARGIYHEKGWTFGMVWMYAGWLAGSAVLWKRNSHPGLRGKPEGRLRARIVLLAFLLIAPISVVASLLVHGYGFILYGMPVITMLVLLLTFYGITRLQFYDIEVRVRRTGDIAASASQTERLAVLGELAATIAHEVRNPLTGVRSLAQRIAEEDVPADKRARYAEVILEETARVERLVNNLLDVSRKPSLSVSSSTSLDVLFEDLKLLVGSRAADKGVVIETKADDAVVKAPREALAQVLLNLLINAIAHTPPGSKIRMCADGNVITIVDQGPGIPTSEREKIFDPFYTTSVDGTGLGLSVVRHLARENNWQVTVDDGQDGGARFKLTV